MLLLIGVGLQRAIVARGETFGRVILPGRLLGLSQNSSQRAWAVDRAVRSDWAERAVDPAAAYYVHSATAVYGALTDVRPGLVISGASLAPGYKLPHHRLSAAAPLPGTHGQRFASGPNGGLLECGPVSGQGYIFIRCLWIDPKTAGIVEFLGRPTISAAAAAVKTNQIRAVAEK